jgi:hypothetical protein
LITAHRNDEGLHSLEATMRDLNEPSGLPILTIADPELVLVSQDYIEEIAVSIARNTAIRVEVDYYGTLPYSTA